MPRACRTCEWWAPPAREEREEADSGFCRVGLPVIIPSPLPQSIHGEWPITQWDDWCGGYERHWPAWAEQEEEGEQDA